MVEMAETLHFSAGKNLGAELTELARKYAYLSETPNKEKGILCIMQSLIGIDISQATDIIEGRKKLVTSPDNMMEMVDDNWTPPDIEGITQKVNHTVKMVIDSYHSIDSNRGAYLHAPYPPSVARLFDMAQIIKEMVKTQPYKALKYSEILIKEHNMIIDDDLIAEDWQLKTKVINSDLPDDVKRDLIATTDGISKAMRGEYDYKKNDYSYNSAWVSPSGKYYGCLAGQHHDVGIILCKQFYPDINHPDEGVMDDKGWLKSSNGAWMMEHEQMMTYQQLDHLKKWMNFHKQTTFKYYSQSYTIREWKAEYLGRE